MSPVPSLTETQRQGNLIVSWPWALGKAAKLKQFKLTVPNKLCDFVRSDPNRVKRSIKCAVALTIAISITITPPVTNFLGTNSTLLGTTAIYLFPNRSVGAQVVVSCIALFGVSLGIAYANFVLFLANQVQDEIQKSPGDVIASGRKAILWSLFVVGAFGSGYMRSRHPRLYLFIVFFMMVNMFALTSGITSFAYVFRNFAIVTVFGAIVSGIVSLVLFPEDNFSQIKDSMLETLTEARQLVLEVEKSIWNSKNNFEEVEVPALATAEKKLSATFKETNYEVSFSRVDPRTLIPLASTMGNLLDSVRVFNATIRGRPQPQFQEITNCTRTASPRLLTEKDVAAPPSPSAVSKRRAISFAFLEAVRVLDLVSSRIEEAYNNKSGTSQLPNIELGALSGNLEKLMAALAEERQKREMSGDGQEENELDTEQLAFLDLLNSAMLDILQTVYEAAYMSHYVTSSGKFRIFLPMKFRRGEKDNPPSSSKPALSTQSTMNLPSDFTHGVGKDEIDLEDQNLDDFRSMETEFVIVRPGNWYTKLALGLSRTLSSVKHSRHIKYGIKFSIVMGILSSPAFIGQGYVWFQKYRVQWGMVSAMIAMETTRGMTFKTAGMKVCGALAGGIFSFITMQISEGRQWVDIILAFFVGLGIGLLVNHPTFAKAGTVFALAFNTILDVGQTTGPSYPTDHHWQSTRAAFARRLLTLPVGLLVALIIHTTVFPFHARAHLSLAISSTLDWLHHLLYAIELSAEEPLLTSQFPILIQRTRRRARFACSLVPATRYEISLVGQFPADGFVHILERIEGIFLLILGESSTRCTTPILAAAALKSTLSLDLVIGRDRGQLIASLCNDLLVISHTLLARLHLPRNASQSSLMLSEYLYGLEYHHFKSHDFSDVGRLRTVVHEMNILREEVDFIMSIATPEGNLLRSKSASASTKDLYSRGTPRTGTPCISRSGSRTRLGNGYSSGSKWGSRATTPVAGPSRASTPAPTMSPRQVHIPIMGSENSERVKKLVRGGSIRVGWAEDKDDDEILAMPDSVNEETGIIMKGKGMATEMKKD